MKIEGARLDFSMSGPSSEDPFCGGMSITITAPVSCLIDQGWRIGPVAEAAATGPVDIDLYVEPHKRADEPDTEPEGEDASNGASAPVS